MSAKPTLFDEQNLRETLVRLTEYVKECKEAAQSAKNGDKKRSAQTVDTDPSFGSNPDEEPDE